MPLWGRWAVLMAATIGRVAPSGSSRLHNIAEGNSLTMVMLYWLAACAMTVLFCSPDSTHVAWITLIGLGVLMVAYLASFALSRRFGGQTEATVMAVGAIVEFTFLLIYLPMARAIYWY
jgi:cobalamin synthase